MNLSVFTTGRVQAANAYFERPSTNCSSSHFDCAAFAALRSLLVGATFLVASWAMAQSAPRSEMFSSPASPADLAGQVAPDSGALPSRPFVMRGENPVYVTRFELAYGRPIVMVMVNGKGPFRFVVDTGTGAQALVTPELAKKLDLPLAGQTSLVDPRGQGAESVPVVSIRSLQVAGVDFTGARAMVHELLKGDDSYDGLLGFVLFRDFLLTLDFPKREMSLTRGALKSDGGISVLPFRMPNGLPIVSMQVGALTVDTQIDSGGTGLSLPEKFASRLNYSFGPVVFATEQTVSTEFKVQGARLAKDVRLGTYKFPQPFVEINGELPLANFGSTPMQDFALTFDQKNDLVLFEARRKSHILSVTPMASSGTVARVMALVD